MMATARQHEELAGAINLLVNAREARLTGFISAATSGEILAEQKLRELFTPDQVDELMTAWECSLEVNPLALSEWRLILDPE